MRPSCSAAPLLNLYRHPAWSSDLKACGRYGLAVADQVVADGTAAFSSDLLR